MKYDIYFHNDFDGRASAAVMLAFLRGRGDDIEHFVPVRYEILPQWLHEDFFEKNKLFAGRHNPAIVVDFLYHPKAAFWFEHHPTTFKKEIWRRNFKPSKFHNWDNSEPSCCSLVLHSLEKHFEWKPPKYLEDLAKWLDIIDGANYRSAKQTVEMKEPALQANNFAEGKSGSPRITVWTIKFLSQHSLSEYTRQKIVREGVEKICSGTRAVLGFYRKNCKIFGNVMVIDLPLLKSKEIAHYAPYYLYPETLYSLRFYQREKKVFHLNVSANPWRRSKNRIHIGDLLKKYGGGGHKNVGGVEFKTRKETEQAMEEIIKRLKR